MYRPSAVAVELGGHADGGSKSPAADQGPPVDWPAQARFKGNAPLPRLQAVALVGEEPHPC